MRFLLYHLKSLFKRLLTKDIFNFFYKLKILLFKKRLNLKGSYKNYSDALKNSNGYQESIILNKVEDAIIKILEGEDVWERDGSIFPNPQPKQKIVEIIEKISNKKLSIIDFGGGLGTLYINNRKLFKSIKKYYVIEQENFVISGNNISKKYNLPIKFLTSLKNIEFNPDIIIFSSVLQYIPNLEEILMQTYKLEPQIILIDRTCYTNNSEMKWHNQFIECYYEKIISYPIRPLKKKYILNLLNNYKVVKKWVNDFDVEIPKHEGIMLKKVFKN